MKKSQIQMGIEIKTKDLQSFVDGTKKADWDVAIAVDAIRIASRVDSVVIVSGDGDFVPLAEYLKQMGVQVEVVCFGQSVSAKLLEEADIFTDLSKDTDYFLIQPGGNSSVRNKNYSAKDEVREGRSEKKNNFKRGGGFDKNKQRYPKNPEALKEHLEAAQEESIPLSDNHFTIVRKK